MSVQPDPDDFDDVHLLQPGGDAAASHSGAFSVEGPPSRGGRLAQALKGLRSSLPFMGGGPGPSFLELREEESDSYGRWCPEETASWWGRATFSWTSSLVALGAAKTLEPEDLWSNAREDEAATVDSEFEAAYQAAKASMSTKPFQVAMMKCYGGAFAKAGVMKLIHDILLFCGPLILKYILQYLQHPEYNVWYGLAWAVALMVTNIIQAFCINAYFHTLFRIGMHIKVAIISILYRKSLKLSNRAKAEYGVGAIANLQSNDANKLWDLPQYLHMVWSGPFQIIVALVMLSWVVHPVPTFCGLVTMLALVPINTHLSGKIGKVRKELMEKTDARVKLVTEVVLGIKAIKLYAWEGPYLERIRKVRGEEIDQTRVAVLLSTLVNFVFTINPTLVAVVVFVVYTYMGYELSAQAAFPALALMNILRFPLMMVPRQIMSVIQARVSLNRIQSFVDAEESTAVPPAPHVGSGVAVAVAGGTFTWGGDGDTPVLRDVSLQVPQGQLWMVVGEVGAGKSSLLMSLLGETRRLAGGVTISGRVAYTAQDTWIQNTTLRGNVLCGQPYDEGKYRKVVAACALQADLDVLPAGDMSEIGEKGINLSGGQKHRVALARAVYADADVYLFDDPLSAVDAHVGKHLFDNCIQGHLGGKTRILVTHQLQYAAGADKIVVVKGGEVEHVGTFDELLAKGVDFHVFEGPAGGEGEREEGGAVDVAVARAGVGAEPAGASEPAAAPAASGGGVGGDKEEAPLPPPATAPAAPAPAAGKLITVEERAVGGVDRAVYLAYLRSWRSSRLVGGLFFAFIGVQVVSVAKDFWLAIWSGDSLGWGVKSYLGMFCFLSMFMAVSQLGRAVILVHGATGAAAQLHSNLVDRVCRLPMAFFDSQPTGRLLNRFTKDTEDVDLKLPDTVNMYLTCLFNTAFSLVTIVFVAPITIFMILPLAAVYRKIQVYYISTSRELKRLDALSRSPLLVHLSETVAGLATVRAFRLQDRFTATNFNHLDYSNRAYFPIVSTNRWLSIRLEVLGTGVVFGAAALVVFLHNGHAGLAGVALTSALQMTSLMNWMVRQNADMESQMNAVERVLHYTEQEPEAPPVLEGHRPPPGWPESGEIVVRDLQVRYREDLELILKGVSFHVQPRQKVGVCGRTGCGKSTLMMALYRIMEPCGGSVVIDGVDITSVGLYDLRSRLALVPQDPVIFSGTVRSNLDPFGEESGDLSLLNALQSAGMGDAVRAMPGGLDAQLTEGGANLSVGQRQLLCMARALLRKARVLVLDEATSNVDNTTDRTIQTTIRTSFKDCTVLTIAHRLHTIVDSDMILLLDAGAVKEFAPPAELIAAPGSAFGAMVESSRRGQSRTSSFAELPAEAAEAAAAAEDLLT